MKQVLMVVLLSLCLGLQAQKLYHSQHLRFDHLTIEDGLPGNTAHAFMQDRLGYLWLGTFNGLVKYDGIKMTVFKENAAENSIKGKFISSIFEDSTGKIWIGTMFNGLNLYEPQTGLFTHFPYDVEKENSLTWPYVTSINEDTEGRIWVSTVNGLSCFEKKTATDDYQIHSYFPPLYPDSLYKTIYQYIDNYPTFELAKIGNNAQLKKEFTVEESTTALIVHMGEYEGKGKLSDQGWITNQEGKTIWKADIDQSRQDGSNYKKSVQIATMQLSAGQYELNYLSDEDFSYEDFYFPKEVRPLNGLTRKSISEHDSLLWGIKVILLPKAIGESIQQRLKIENTPFSNTISNARIYTLFKDTNAQLWIGSAGGLSQIQLSNDKDIQFQHYKITDDSGNGLKADLITQIKQKNEQTFWITGMTYDENKKLGLSIETFQPNDNKFETIYKNADITDYTQILETPNKNIWMASFGHGLFNLKPTQKTENAYPYQLQKYDLPNDFAWQLFEDKSGVIWAGTWQAGGFKLNSSANIFPFYRLEENTNIQKEKLATLTVLEDANENLWLGTRDNGLYKWDRTSHSFVHFQKDNGLLEGSILSLKEDRKGNIWIGTEQGLCRYFPKTNSFKNYFYNEKNERTISNSYVHAIEEDAVGRIWVGTRKGLCLYQPISDDFTRIPTFHEDNGVETNRVNKIIATDDGYLWLSYYFEGLVKVKAEELATELMTNKLTFFFKGTELDVIDMHLDKEQRLWLGDHQVGLQMIDTKTQETYYFPRTNKDELNNVSAITEDKNGQLWLSNSKGLSVFDKEQKTFRTFNKDDGIDFDFADPGPSIRTKNGEFLVGGANGFYLFHSDSINISSLPPKVTFTDIKLFNETLKIGENSPLKQHISYTKEINLNYQQNTLAISYAGLHFDKPKRIQYAYMLEEVANVFC